MRAIFTRLGICICLFGAFLVRHVQRQNDLTRLRLEIPQIAMQARALEERALQLQEEVGKLQTPKILLEQLDRSEFAHLRAPLPQQIWMLEEETRSRPPLD